MDSDQPDFIDKLIAKVDAEEAELKMLREFHNEVGAALANEKAGDIEHLLATVMLGKHTTVIGRGRLKQLNQAETDLPMWQRFASYCRCCAQSGESDPDDFDTFNGFNGNLD